MSQLALRFVRGQQYLLGPRKNCKSSS